MKDQRDILDYLKPHREIKASDVLRNKVRKALENHIPQSSENELSFEEKRSKPFLKRFMFYGAAAIILILLITNFQIKRNLGLPCMVEKPLLANQNIAIKPDFTQKGKKVSFNMKESNEQNEFIEPQDILLQKTPAKRVVSNNKKHSEVSTKESNSRDTVMAPYLNEIPDDYFVISDAREAAIELEKIEVKFSNLIEKGLSAQSRIPDLNKILNTPE